MRLSPIFGFNGCEPRCQPEFLSKPRISFRNNKQSAGRLNEMILAINEMGAEV